MNKQSLTKLALGGIMAGGMMLMGCDNMSDPAPAAPPAKASITAAKTLADFQAACGTITGSDYKIHDCKGQNTCHGHSFKDGVVGSHDCTGKSSCVGASCIEP